jgi:arylsulfatase
MDAASDTALAPGKHTISYEFIPDAAKLGTGGKFILSVDGAKASQSSAENVDKAKS